MNTRSVEKWLRTVALLAAGAWSVSGAAAPSPYGAISVHNPFRLQPAVTPPPTPEPSGPKPTSALTVEVTGVTSFGGRRALLEIAEAGKPVCRPVLTEGGAADGVEVVRVEVETGRVTARIHGVERLLFLREGGRRSAQPTLRGR